MPNASLRNLLVKLKLRWISCANFRKPLRESAQPNPGLLKRLWAEAISSPIGSQAFERRNVQMQSDLLFQDLATRLRWLHGLTSHQ
jgi:hypothetical protein